MTVNQLFALLFTFKGNPRVFIEEDFKNYTVTFHFHRHHQKRFHDYPWIDVKPMAVIYDFKTASHAKLKELCKGHQLYFKPGQF